MTPFEIIITTSGTTAFLIGLVLWLARNLIQERLRRAVKHEYDTKLARLQADLDLLKQKEISGHQEKLNAYRLIADVLAELYADLEVAANRSNFDQVRDKYNRSWIRCYGYLSMIAPQDVMDAFDKLNDYILTLISGRQAPQPWSETRKLALTFINCMRKDIGLNTSEIKYHGNL